jgi:hypothetical protein
MQIDVIFGYLEYQYHSPESPRKNKIYILSSLLDSRMHFISYGYQNIKTKEYHSSQEYSPYKTFSSDNVL